MIADFEEREEGEIVDDFESISDYSIRSPPSCTGKSDSPRDLLQGISLSSISDSGTEDICVVKHHPRRRHKKRKRRPSWRRSPEHRSKSRRKSEECRTRREGSQRKRKHSSTESDDEGPDFRTLKQLRDAVRIETSQEVQHKSLRTRLKAMIKLDSGQSPGEEDEIEALRTLALLSNTRAAVDNLKSTDDKEENDIAKVNVGGLKDEKEETLDDEDLIELRLAALKSAIIKKATERKRRKEKFGVNKENDVILENNDVSCENAVVRENLITKENCKGDEILCDVYPNGDNSGVYKRTENGCASRNTKKPASEVPLTSEVMLNHDKVTNVAIKDEESVPSNTKLIEANNTSVEEDIDIMRAMLLASMSNRITSNPITHPVSNKSSVNRENLNRRRNVPPRAHTNFFRTSKLPTIKPLIINLNESDSDTDLMEKKETSTDSATKTEDKDLRLVNTVTQFLKTQRAAVEAKTKSENSSPSLDKSVVKLLSKQQQLEYQVLKQKLLMARKKRVRKASHKLDNKVLVTKKIVKVESPNRVNVFVNRLQEMNLGSLQKALEDMQIQKNGRLQIKGRYKELAPVLHKVNQASLDHKQCETEVKRLLDELQKMRSKLAASHQHFTNLVKHLMSEKDAIDRRPNSVLEALTDIKCTSTPIKPCTETQICDITCISELSSIVSTAKVEDVDPEREVKDNIDKAGNSEAPFQKYVSPLDMKNREDAINDPLLTYCPYELFGLCKDPECRFNHYLTN